MKKILKTLALTISFLLAFEAFSFVAFAENPTEFVEEHIQFNLDEFNIYVENKNKLIIHPNANANFIKKHQQKKSIKYLKTYFEEYPSIEKEIINAINNNQYISTFGYTEAEFIADEDGDMIRVKNENNSSYKSVLGYKVLAANIATGQNTEKFYFTFATMITRSGTKNPYTYSASSIGAWSKNSILGGEKYPASGYDCIAQAAPTTLTRTSHSLEIDYTSGKNAINGTDYWLEKGGTNYLCFQVADDPSGSSQMSDVGLFVNYSGNSSNSNRIINSYYVHTWTSMTFDISIGVSASGDQSIDFGLNIKPSITSKSWTVYSYVSFKF